MDRHHLFGETDLQDRLDELTVFSALHQDKVFDAFHQLMFAAVKSFHSEEDICSHSLSYVHALTFGRDWLECRKMKKEYIQFSGLLYQADTDNWTEYLKNLIFSVDTPCLRFAAKGLKIPEFIEKTARKELKYLSEITAINSENLKKLLYHPTGAHWTHPEQSTLEEDKSGKMLPDWNAEKIDLETLYFDRIANISKYGFGIWAEYKMFRMELSDKSEKGYRLKPVSSPDSVRLDDLIGYEIQRQQVIENTSALLGGLKASNILLYGSAGTGKSATVKAVANAFAGQGLRLIELSKNELHLLPELLEELNSNPLKFILFIDDLSFQENDDDFSALKAVLEGSISERANNTVIYATSNRRHIVRETFSQRAGDEVHRNDTVQETVSLSERFGIQLLFDKPGQKLYLEIVRRLAEQYHLHISPEQLEQKAEQFAMRKSGRSARAARQLVEQLRCAEYQENL